MSPVFKELILWLGRTIFVGTNINPNKLKMLGKDVTLAQAQWKLVGLADAKMTFHLHQSLFKQLSPSKNVINNYFCVCIVINNMRPDCCARAFYWLLISWMKLINVAGPFVGPKGMTVYVPLMALGPWRASFSWLAKATASWWYPIGVSNNQKNIPRLNSSLPNHNMD